MSTDERAPESLAPTSLRGIVAAAFDAAVPLGGFLVGYENWNVATGAALGVAAALAIGAWRWRRGESLLVVAIATLVVAVSAAIAALTGEGRGFFMLGAIGTTFGAVACIVSLPARRPATGVIARWLRLELADWHRSTLRYQLHRRLTWVWLAYWALFAAAMDTAFVRKDITWLSIDDTVMKISVLVMLAVSIMVIRRGRTSAEPQ